MHRDDIVFRHKLILIFLLIIIGVRIFLRYVGYNFHVPLLDTLIDFIWNILISIMGLITGTMDGYGHEVWRPR